MWLGECWLSYEMPTKTIDDFVRAIQENKDLYIENNCKWKTDIKKESKGRVNSIALVQSSIALL